VRIVSWNLAGRVKRLDEQAKRLLALEADHLCLQEVTPNTLIQWELLLGDAGYDTIQHGEPDPSTERSRPLMVLSTSRGASARVAVADAPSACLPPPHSTLKACPQPVLRTVRYGVLN
jgi:hypothetical protein